MKTLIITEKPSVAQTIAAVVGAITRKDGYIEGNGYIVGWCLGHLAQLVGAEAYDPQLNRWRVADLPILPQDWRYRVPQDKRKQFGNLRWLMLRDDVSQVINACDAGREGELIFRNLYELTGCTKPTLRLWLNSMEEAEIRRALGDLRPGADYDRLFAAARCRERADWLVGINATRLLSVTYHRTLNTGRVVSPTLALLTQREADIAGFVPESFCTAELHLGEFSAESKRFSNRAEAEEAVVSAGGKCVVTAVSTKEKSEAAPAHFTEGTLLTAMENAGDTPDEAERKGLGTPATRAGIIEKLVAAGFIERKEAKKNVSLIPTQTGAALTAVLPEQLASAELTSEREQKLIQVERGELAPEAFMAGIEGMVRELCGSYTPKFASPQFPTNGEVIGKCPRCGCNVVTGKKGYFCESSVCRFALWTDNKFLAAKRIRLSKSQAAQLLRDGRIHIDEVYSAKHDAYYPADLILKDDGERVIYWLDFGRKEAVATYANRDIIIS